MSDRCHIDIESFSEIPITDEGSYKYAEDLSTEILCTTFRFNDGPYELWLPQTETLGWSQDLVALIQKALPHVRIHVQRSCPGSLVEWAKTGKKFAAHNAGFERIMLNGLPGKALDFPETPVSQWICTAAKSRAHGLPGALAQVAEALGTAPKNDAGRGVMLQVTKPKKITKADPTARYLPQTHPDKFLDLCIYNVDDVTAECGVDDAVPDLTPFEQAVWQLDQAINDRGVAVDADFIHDAQAVVEEYRAEIEAEFEKTTGLKPTQREKVADWIRTNGWPHLTDMQAETVNILISETSKVPPHIKRVLELYQTYGMKAVSKFQVMLDAACADGRVRGMFVYHGAGTGRWSSMLIQLQNLFRPVIDDVGTAIDALRVRSLAFLRMLGWTTKKGALVNPMKIIASTIRGALVAAYGYVLLALDFAGIESRVTAWMAGETWKVESFRAYDTIIPGKFDKDGKPARVGHDNYVLAYARAFRVAIEKVTKAMRQIGKVMELALGYEGGVGAFVTMAKTYGVNLDELAELVWPIIPERTLAQAEALYEKMGKGTGLAKRTWIAIDCIKRMWREAHPAIVRMWWDLKDAAFNAVKHEGKVFAIPNKMIMFMVKEYKGRKWLYMRLPSGRKVAYYAPEVEYETSRCPTCWSECPSHDFQAFICSTCDGEGVVRIKGDCKTCGGKGRVTDFDRGTVTYMGTDTKTRQWSRVPSYGGKWTENAVQATSRDLLVAGMLKLEAASYRIIMTVHDEIVCENPESFGSLDEAEKLMCDVPAWAAGLPVAAEGWVDRRYKK